METPRISFVIVSYNTRELLDACVTSIDTHTQGLSYEVIVVDNASRDGSVEMLKAKHPAVRVIESGENLGFGRANNLGCDQARSPFVMLLNSDALLQSDTASALVAFLEGNPKVGLVGPDIVLFDGTRQPKTRGMLPSARVMLNQNLLLSVLFPRSRALAGLYVEHDWAQAYPVGWVSGVCMVVRREVYAQVGGFDPQIFMYAEDVDLCARLARAGWETWRLAAHPVRHLCGGSTKTDVQVLRNRVLQQRNFMRLLDRSMGPGGRLLTRFSYVVGLALRCVLRGVSALRGGRQRILALKADLRCLADMLLPGLGTKGGLHAGGH